MDILKNLPTGILPSRAEMRDFIQKLRALNNIEEASIIMNAFLNKYEEEFKKNPFFFEHFVYKPLYNLVFYNIYIISFFILFI